MTIEGIEVLNTIPAILHDIPYAVLFIGLFVGLILIGLSDYFFIKNNDILSLKVTIILIVGVVIASLSLICFGVKRPVRYEVVLDSTVSYNEFCDQYEVIAKEGKIITVQKRGE